MKISTPNENGVLPCSEQERVASHGRSYASIEYALWEDGLIRYSIHFQYSHGGFGGPISIDDDGYETKAAARIAGLEELLRRWHKPFPSEPQHIHDELRLMREQIESSLNQPSLF